MRSDPGLWLWFALFVALGAAGTWLARAYAIQRRMLDPPGERRSHRLPTPRGGGVAIAMALMIAIGAMIVRTPSEIVLLAGAGFGLLLVAGIGWLDDHRPLSAWLRLSVHAVAALSLAAGIVLSGGSLVSGLIALSSVMVLVNVWNFMDGIDGLAASQAALVVAVFVVCAGGGLAVHLGLALLAAIFGFLPFNLPRAKIFLGDVGSGALGYALALTAGLAMERMPVETWILLFLPLSAFLLDAGLTLLTRILRGERWWTPHVSHVYQRWARRSGGHGRVTTGYALWTAAASGCIWLFGGEDSRGNAMLVAAWFVLGAGLWCWLRSRAPLAHPSQGAAP